MKSVAIMFWMYSSSIFACGFMVARSIYKGRADNLEESLEIERLLNKPGKSSPNPRGYNNGILGRHSKHWRN